MRLQVTVLRHDLPEVRLIYNTESKHGSSIARIVTVSDLLSGISALVQLESSEGDWGLEDYVVEVAATADQSQTYECFHFQEVKDVLREDDEVLIRGLTTEELRDRRRGGRLQITGDGRHLVDGLSWGRRWRAGASTARPGFMIPPRKRRRITIEPDVDEDIKLELEYPPGRIRDMVPFVNGGVDPRDGDEEDDEEDEDYNDNDDYEDTDDEDEEQDSARAEEELDQEVTTLEEPSLSNSPRRIIAKATFDDADVGDDDEQQEEHNTDTGNRGDGQPLEEVGDSATQQQAISEALTETGIPNPSDDMGSSGRQGSESALDQLIATSQMNATLDGLTPQQISPPVDRFKELVDMMKNPRRFKQIEKFAEDLKLYRIGRISIDDIEKLHGLGKYRQGSTEKAELDGFDTAAVEDDATNRSAISSSEDEVSEEDSSEISSSEESDSEADASSDEDEDDESSDESPDSGESTSSSDSSLSSTRSTTKPVSPPALEIPSKEITSNQQVDLPKALPHKNNPPGTGQNKTKRNNERKKLSKLLSNLKEAGTLEPDADFKTLRDYLAGRADQDLPQDEIGEEVKTSTMQDRVSARAEEILARLNSEKELVASKDHDNDSATMVPISHNIPSDTTISQFLPEKSTASVNEVVIPEPPTNLVSDNTTIAARHNRSVEQDTEELSPKRVRLDVAASRRMLFNSLGVRNPKTAEAEKALKEQLAKPVRKIKSRVVGREEEIRPQAVPAQDRWRRKFTVLAVECVQDWKKVDTPPFPFKQPWQVRQEKAEMAKTTRQQEVYEETLNYDEAEEDHDTQPMDMEPEPNGGQPSQSITTSRTLTAGTTIEDDDIPIPSDFSTLAALTKSNLSKAAIVAYKELHMNARFEPEQSSYRVARVISYADNTLRLRLAATYRRSPNLEYDEATGDRRYNPFEVPNDDDEEHDDGFRDVEFEQMISPKIVATSGSPDNVVPQETYRGVAENTKTAGPSLRGGHLSNAIQHFSQTLEDAVDVATPRRAEINDIIKEAGCDSAVNGQLLQGLDEVAAQAETSSAIDDESAVDANTSRTDVWQSSSPQHTSPAPDVTDVSGFRESSVPSESMVESVKYPQLSALEFDTPVPAQSSSHQDAQNPTPVPILAPEESTNLETTLPGPIDDSNAEPDSLPSEVPQTQSQDFIPDSLGEDQPNHRYDASAAPPHQKSARSEEHLEPFNNEEDEDDDNESVDSNGLPSLRSLTSSQARKVLDPMAKNPITKLRYSPPEPTRRSPRTRKPTARSSDWSDTDTPSQLQAQTHTTFKASQSQAHRLSQIPDDTIFVDLTQSSPVDSDKGRETGQETGKESEESKGARKGQEHDGRGARGASNVFKRSFEGLGEKSYLKKRKKSG